jgi:hypothetical protein
VLKGRNNFDWKVTTLRPIFKEMGSSEKRKKKLIERENIVN